MLRSLRVDEKLFKDFNRTKYKGIPGGAEGALERVRQEVEASDDKDVSILPDVLKQQHIELGKRLDERDKALRVERRAKGGELAKQVLVDYDAEIGRVGEWGDEDATEKQAMDDADGDRHNARGQ
jgi:hypothetical protein